MVNWFKKNSVKKNNESSSSELTIRKKEIVAERILALLAVIGKVHQGGDKRFTDWFENNGISKYLSDNEKIFIYNPSPSYETIRNFSWRAEALTSLLWSIGFIDNMPNLKDEFEVYSVDGIGDIIKNPLNFRDKIRLRSESEIIKMELDLLHEHWRVRDAQLFGKEMPKDLNPSIVYERRYALSWIVGWGNDWDYVPTDT